MAMSLLHASAPVLLALAVWALPVQAAEDMLSQQLAEQARRWQQKDRDDLAANVWRKLLTADPNHGEALVNLGLIEARAGHVREAQALYNRAAKRTPPAAGLRDLARALQSELPSQAAVPVLAASAPSRWPSPGTAAKARAAPGPVADRDAAGLPLKFSYVLSSPPVQRKP